MPIPAKDPHCGACVTGQPHAHGRIPDPRIPGPGVPDLVNDWRPLPGMWVKVWASVVDGAEEGHRVHPEDLLIEVLCHNVANRVPVRRDHVMPSDDSYPPSATRCASLYETDEGTLVHCEAHLPPGHQHRTERPGFQWDDAQAYGYVEVR